MTADDPGPGADPESAERTDAAAESDGHAKATADTPDDADARPAAPGDDWTRRVRRYVEYGVLGALVLVGTLALVQLYVSASSVIATWVTPEYRSLIRAAFNLAVLLLVGAAVSWRLRRLGAFDAGD